jgi:DNA-binding NtrC family response regulator
MHQVNGTDSNSLPVIFVVDDEPMIAETQAIILRLHAYDAIAFTNPLSALSAALNRTPDLLLSDFQMPEMNGLSLATELLLRCPKCKVLMISGAISHARNHPAVGMFEFLQKPVSPLDLLAKIRATLDSAVVRTIPETNNLN